jgi:hypothetical protein
MQEYHAKHNTEHLEQGGCLQLYSQNTMMMVISAAANGIHAKCF